MRRTAELRRRLARHGSSNEPWETKLGFNAVSELDDLQLAWDATVDLYIAIADPLDDAKHTALRNAGVLGITAYAGGIAIVSAPLSRLACFADLDFVRRVDAPAQLEPN